MSEIQDTNRTSLVGENDVDRIYIDLI